MEYYLGCLDVFYVVYKVKHELYGDGNLNYVWFIKWN